MPFKPKEDYLNILYRAVQSPMGVEVRVIPESERLRAAQLFQSHIRQLNRPELRQLSIRRALGEDRGLIWIVKIAGDFSEKEEEESDAVEID